MFLKTRCLLIAIVCLGLATDLQAKSPKNFSRNTPTRLITIEQSISPLVLGRKLVFDVFWMGIPVGIGTIEIKEKLEVAGRKAYHIVAVAKTNDFLSKLYPVQDEVHSFIDAERLCSLEFRKTLSEGHYRADEKIVYDYKMKKGRYESLRNKSKKEFDIPDPTQDIVSAFFWFCGQPIKVGESVKTQVNDKARNWDLEVKVLGTQSKKIRGQGAMDTVIVEPVTKFKGVFEKRGSVLINLTADKRRIPVWVIFRTPYGHVVGVFNAKKSSII